MKYKLNFLILSGIFILVSVAYGAWSVTKATSTDELVQTLSASQQKCVEQAIGNNDLIYADKDTHTGSLNLGYHDKDNYYAAIIKTDPDICIIEFQERIWNCYEERIKAACLEGYEFEAGDIQQIELTGNPPTEIYITFDTRGVGIHHNAHHIFYTEKPNGEYVPLLHLQLCLRLSSVEVDYSSQIIVATDDLVCDMFHGRKEHLEYSLHNGELTVLADWFDE